MFRNDCNVMNTYISVDEANGFLSGFTLYYGSVCPVWRSYAWRHE